jgi:hypothetical protein
MPDSSEDQCCSVPAPETDGVYVPRGVHTFIPQGRTHGQEQFDLPVYMISSTSDTKKALVCIYGKSSNIELESQLIGKTSSDCTETLFEERISSLKNWVFRFSFPISFVDKDGMSIICLPRKGESICRAI